MLITTLGPKEILDWFHSSRTDNVVLCFYVGASASARKSIESFILNFYEFDGALGPYVAFMLFLPEGHASLLADRHILLGEMIGNPKASVHSTSQYENRVQPLRECPYLTSKQREDAALQAARFSNEIAAMFGIDFERLPALCVVAKMKQEVTIISIDEDQQERDLIIWLSGLARIASEDEEGVAYDYLMLQRLPGVIKQAQVLAADIETAKAGVLRKFEAMCEHKRASDQDKTTIAAYLSQSSKERIAFRELLAQLSFGEEILRQENPFAQLKRSIEVWDGLVERAGQNLAPLVPRAGLAEELARIDRRSERISHYCKVQKISSEVRLQAISTPGLLRYASALSSVGKVAAFGRDVLKIAGFG